MQLLLLALCAEALRTRGALRARGPAVELLRQSSHALNATANGASFDGFASEIADLIALCTWVR